MNLRAFDLNLLRILDALLSERSVTRAGHRVGLSQPAMSAALGRLRAALNDPLFIRHGHSLKPTDFAVSLELPLREILDRLETVLSGPPDFDPARCTDVFKISGSDFFAEMLMPTLADRLATAAPGVRVQLVDLVPDNYVTTLERYEVDLAILPVTDFPEWVDHRPMFHSSFAMIARKGHKRLRRAGIAPGDTVPIDLFCDLGHILFSPEGKLKAMGDAALARVGRQRRVVMTMPIFYGVCGAVAESDQVALIPRQLAHSLGPKLGLSVYEPPMKMELPLICMVWHKRVTNAPAHRWLRGVIADILCPLNQGERTLPLVAAQ